MDKTTLGLKTSAIIPAAGTGERLGMAKRKPYVLLNNRPLLYYSLAAFERIPVIQQIIVAVCPGDERYCRETVIEKFHFKKDIQIISGGEHRQESVRRLLEQVAADAHLVLIHDGARPFITPELLEKAISETVAWKATALAVPVKDTIKSVNRNFVVKKTLCREQLWAIQTPQTFEKTLICAAHEKARNDGFVGTDDAGLVERLGVPVKIVMGSYNNIKITTPEDLFFAEALLKKETP